jgi:hypothetical protein
MGRPRPPRGVGLRLKLLAIADSRRAYARRSRSAASLLAPLHDNHRPEYHTRYLPAGFPVLQNQTASLLVQEDGTVDSHVETKYFAPPRASAVGQRRR